MTNRSVTRFVTHSTQVTSISDAGLPYSEAMLPLEIGAARAPRLSVVAMQRLRGVAAPLYHRVRRGEGGLLIVNATLALKWYPVREALSLVAISFISLLSLYLFNDLIDARDDRQNPKKDRVIAEMY